MAVKPTTGIFVLPIDQFAQEIRRTMKSRTDDSLKAKPESIPVRVDTMVENLELLRTVFLRMETEAHNTMGSSKYATDLCVVIKLADLFNAYFDMFDNGLVKGKEDTFVQAVEGWAWAAERNYQRGDYAGVARVATMVVENIAMLMLGLRMVPSK
jgi:hypothetical protein